MKTMKGFLALLAVFFFMAAAPFSASGAEAAKDGGITAIFDLSRGFINLTLVDSATRATITKARVEAVVTSPAGKKTKAELGYMKMDKGNSFMNMSALKMTEMGEYTFKISVEAGKKKGNFAFKSAAR